jgi:hypothetical protein
LAADVRVESSRATAAAPSLRSVTTPTIVPPARGAAAGTAIATVTVAALAAIVTIAAAGGYRRGRNRLEKIPIRDIRPSNALLLAMIDRQANAKRCRQCSGSCQPAANLRGQRDFLVFAVELRRRPSQVSGKGY